ncbi:MAG: ribonuclease HII [Lachnospiraceae bacterium]|nr:ribonuclease HII [Lachnospiraceae bacterium]
MSNVKIAEIKNEFENTKMEEYEKLFEKYSSDQRVGVIKLLDTYRKKRQAYHDEIARMYQMFEFERKYADFENICGVDEVGRGPLAGPVCAGAVILPKTCEILYLNDSKQLSEKKREELYIRITHEAIAYKTAFVSHEIIDEINILQATYRAMQTAIGSLSVQPDVLLNDAVNIPQMKMKQVAIIKGDARSASIAAASIIAKVERDRLMEEFDEIYPEYGFAANKGYGSKQHIEAIKEYGPSPIHRLTFLKEDWIPKIFKYQ